MKTEQLNIDQPDTTTLSDIVEPLGRTLQTLTEHPRDQIEIVSSIFEGQEARPNEAYLELDMYAETSDQLLRALWTLLEKTGGSDRWLNFCNPDDTNPFSGPIAFALVRQLYGSGHLKHHSYLWCYCRDRDFDLEAAKQQIANLVALIGNPDNLMELELEHRMQL